MSEHIEVSNMSILPLSCAGVGTLTVNVLFNAATEPGGSDYGVGVYVDGSFNTSLVPTVDGMTAFNVSLGGGNHAVDLWSSQVTYRRGAFVDSYSVDSGTVTVRAVAKPTRRMGALVDSIGCGAVASPATQLGYLSRGRGVYPGRIAFLGWGGMSLYDHYNAWFPGKAPGGDGLGSMANLAARLVATVQQDNPATRELWIAIGTNDATWGSQGRWSAANFGTAYGQLLDAIHALDPGIRVYAVSPLITGIEGLVNAFGDSPPAYRTEISNAAAARPTYVTYVHGPDMMAGNGLSGDSLHPTNTGHLACFNGTGAAAGSTNFRAVVSV
jgi:lysophospholipase L1-like esterase